MPGAAAHVRATHSGKKGLGVFASRDLPAFAFVAAYPGRYMTRAQHSKLIDAGLATGRYAISFYRPDKNGVVRSNYIVDPGSPDGTVAAEFRGHAAPFVNEPPVSKAPNLVWVWNLPSHRMEYWTLRAVRRGEELTACYGTGGGYLRSYQTSCVVRQGEVEPVLHVLISRGSKPVPYTDLGNAGVRRAVLGLRRRHSGGPA